MLSVCLYVMLYPLSSTLGSTFYASPTPFVILPVREAKHPNPKPKPNTSAPTLAQEVSGYAGQVLYTPKNARRKKKATLLAKKERKKKDLVYLQLPSRIIKMS